MAAYSSFTVPFVTWLLMGYFESVPEELEQAAMIDGATRTRAFVRVVVPLSAPGALAAGLYAFTQAWNEFLYVFAFITDVKLRTLPVGLSTLIAGDVYGWVFLMAGAALTTVPVIAAYVYLQRYMVEGLTAGSVKGRAGVSVPPAISLADESGQAFSGHRRSSCCSLTVTSNT